MRRRQWFSLHSWAGVQVSLLLCLVLVTGTLATISQDIDWLTNPAIRASHSAETGSPPWGEFLNQVQSIATVQRVESINLPADKWRNAEAVVIDVEGKRRRFYLDRNSGELAGDGRWYNWQRFFRQLHRHLMMPIPVGVTMVCLLVIPLAITLVSSLHIYKHWYRNFFRWPTLILKIRSQTAPSPLRKTRHFWGEMHRFAGIWSLGFIALMIVTASWYLLEEWGLAATYPDPIPESYRSAAVPVVSPKRLQFLIAAAAEQYPQLILRNVIMPTPGRAYISFRGQADALLVRDRANQVVLDVVSGQLLSLRKGEKLNLHARISEAADPLHFGTFANGPSRWLWFVFGMLLSGLAITGLYLQTLRFAAGTNAPPGMKHIMASGWRSMTYVRWPLAILVLIAFYLAATTFIPGY